MCPRRDASGRITLEHASDFPTSRPYAHAVSTAASGDMDPAAGMVMGEEAMQREYRHYQEVIDALGRSLSLVSVLTPEHDEWLRNEARALAHRNHPSIPTTYHYWASHDESRRGPGYLRRWISGETVYSRVARLGTEAIPFALQVLREAGSTLAYLHDTAVAHGAVSPSAVWLTPGGRLWLLGWEWVLPRDQRPAGLIPDAGFTPWAPEWEPGVWRPTPLSDQWQLAAMMFTMLTGETAPEQDAPPIALLRPDCPQALATVLERALMPDPAQRYPSVATMLRELDRHVSVRPAFIEPEGDEVPMEMDSPEARLRWVTADDYEILSPLGEGMFGSVWRARDLSLSREVAIKVLHPHIAKDDVAVARFRREARHAAQLAHAAIVPIYESDSRGGVVWYTMELAEGVRWRIWFPERDHAPSRRSRRKWMRYWRRSMRRITVASSTGTSSPKISSSIAIDAGASAISVLRMRWATRAPAHRARRRSRHRNSCLGKRRDRRQIVMRWPASCTSC